MGVTVKNVYSDVDYYFCASVGGFRDPSMLHIIVKGRNFRDGIAFQRSLCNVWLQYRTRKFLTRDEKKKIDPATARHILLPLLYFRLTFRYCTTIPSCKLSLSINTYVKPPNYTDVFCPVLLTVTFNSVSFYICFLFFLTLFLTLFLPPLCEISINLYRISINLFLLRLAMSRFLLFLDIAEPTKKTH